MIPSPTPLAAPVRLAFPSPRRIGRLVRRYKRFLADIELDDGRVITAHTSNTGPMLGLREEGAPALVWDSQNPKRKLPHSWLAVQIDGAWVGCDTQLPNRLAAAAVAAGVVPGVPAPTRVAREQPMEPGSRVDLVAWHEGAPPLWIEVKSVTLARGRRAEFPDTVSARGLKHLRALARRVAAGDRALMLYVVQRDDVDTFAPAADLDPAYAVGLREASDAGVGVAALRATLDPDGATLTASLPVAIPR